MARECPALLLLKIVIKCLSKQWQHCYLLIDWLIGNCFSQPMADHCPSISQTLDTNIMRTKPLTGCRLLHYLQTQKTCLDFLHVTVRAKYTCGDRPTFPLASIIFFFIETSWQLSHRLLIGMTFMSSRGWIVRTLISWLHQQVKICSMLKIANFVIMYLLSGVITRLELSGNQQHNNSTASLARYLASLFVVA